MTERSEIRSSVDPWLTPISDAKPCGDDPRFAPRFDSIRAEVRKLDDPGAGMVDWKSVVMQCEAALKEDAKELGAATYLAFGWAQTSGLSGVAKGAWLLADMLDRYWEEMFPPPSRGRARANALRWYVDRLEPILTSYAISEPDRSALAESMAAYTRLAEITRERLGEDAPGMRTVSDALKRLELSAGTSQSAPSSSRGSEAAGAPLGAASAPPGGGANAQVVEAPAPRSTPRAPDLTTPELADGSLASIEQFLRQTSRTLLAAIGGTRKASPEHAKTFRVWMTALYLPLQQLPETHPSDAQRTTTPAPPRQLMADAETTPRTPSPTGVEQAIWGLERHRLAFDLHRLLHETLTVLGGPWSELREAHACELRALVARLPGIISLSFSDGTPFASDSTREFLVSLGGNTSPAPTAVAPPSSNAPKNSFAEAMEVARRLARQGQKKEALEMLTRARSLSLEGRERFLLTFEAAKLCHDMGALHVAAPLYAELADAVREHGLARWDRDLASQVMVGFYRCLSALHGKPGKKDSNGHGHGFVSGALPSESEIYAQLCQLDPALALTVRP